MDYMNNIYEKETMNFNILESVAKYDMEINNILVEHIKDVHYGKVYCNDEILLEADYNLLNSFKKAFRNVLDLNINNFKVLSKGVDKFRDDINKGLLFQLNSSTEIKPVKVTISRTSLLVIENNGEVNLTVSTIAMDTLKTIVSRIMDMMLKERLTVNNEFDFKELEERVEGLINEFRSAIFKSDIDGDKFEEKVRKLMKDTGTKTVMLDNPNKVVASLDKFLEHTVKRLSYQNVKNCQELSEITGVFDIFQSDLKRSMKNVNNKISTVDGDIDMKVDLKLVNKYDRICLTAVNKALREAYMLLNFDTKILSNTMDDVKMISSKMLTGARRG